MTSEQLKNKLKENEDSAVAGICDILSNYEGNICTYLVDFVSSLCGVDKDLMFSDTKSIDVAQARGLFFYAYRYMTCETHKKIGLISESVYGKGFTAEGVSSSIKKMSSLIENEPTWNKRWHILKLIIKSQEDVFKEPPVSITIKVPKNVKATIEHE